MRAHFPPMHAMAVEQFWVPGQLCELQGVCSPEPGQLLQLVTLEQHPLAQCNDGTAAVYYRRPLNSAQDTRKLLIFLKGGGLCAPAAGYSCWARCKDGNPLCTAATEPELDPGHHDNIFSSDPVKNPAFFDFNYGECGVEARAVILPSTTAQGDYDGRGQRIASPMLTAIMSGGVGISGRELSTQLINSLEQANHSFS